ncbi:TPA: acetyltransferase, partial [Streptococcus suis]
TADIVVLEKEVLLASYINIIGENHSINPESEDNYGKQPLQTSSIRIREGAWIGQSVSIISGKDGIVIGKKSIVGTGSVVTKSIPDYSIAVGNPAKVIKTYNFDKHVWEKIT